MAMLSRILMPVDFSPRCRGAAHYAEALACQFKSEIVMLHVVATPHGAFAPPEALTYSTITELIDEMVAQRTTDLNHFLEEEIKDIPVRRVVLRGDPARRIVEMAAEKHCDLIVMSTHGYGPFRRFLLGSVTAKVLHDACCPVWTGPHLEQAPARESIKFQRVLCALDMAPHSAQVLCWGAAFAREFGAALGIVHAIPLSTARMGGIYFDPDWGTEVKTRTRAAIAGMQAQFHTTADVAVEIGDPSLVVNDVARRLSADLLVIGRGAPGLLGRLRANAYAILRESPCAVVGV